MLGLFHFYTKIILWFKGLFAILAAPSPQVLQAVTLPCVVLCFVNLNKSNFPEIGLLV